MSHRGWPDGAELPVPEPRAPSPATSEVDVFLLHPDACSPDDRAGLLAWLHPAELERYHRFVFDRHRIEYLATRALVRRALSSYRTIEPAAWQFRSTAHGRPELDPPCGLIFNVANHPTLIVCAIRTGAELGVDVEPLTRGPEILPLADTVFAPRERTALRALPAPAQPDRALSLWTLKEAYIKARGLGLSLPLDGFAFTFDADRPQISFAPTLSDTPDRWTFRTTDLLDHRIALALEATGAPPIVRVHHVLRLSPAIFDAHRLADWP
jgi:4'-phosphopantetheinyl transferase